MGCHTNAASKSPYSIVNYCLLMVTFASKKTMSYIYHSKYPNNLHEGVTLYVCICKSLGDIAMVNR